MNHERKLQTGPVANSTDYPPVEICFADSTINTLFAELLQAQGIPTHICYQPAAVAPGTKIVTEPLYLPELQHLNPNDCLVVGSRHALSGCSAVLLCQPLTEHKIQTAIRTFLSH